MARLWESDTSQRVSTRVCLAVLTALLIYSLALSHLKSRSTREVLASTEHSVEYIDPASIDLTLLVNTLINSTQKGNQHLFSLLSVTSHSLLALHKLTLLVYNMSNFQEMESSVFPMRYCYCVTNKTNDLTDFTAILLDVMGNSTTHLQELFKSSSILSVNQRNSSDCIYICVMAGKTDRDLSQMWNVDSITPLFNQTIMEYSHRDNTSHLKLLVDWPHLASDMGLFQVQPSEGSREQSDTTASTAPPTTVTTTTIRSSLTDQTAGCPWKAELSFNSVSREDLRHSRPTLSPLKLQPCVFELCKFFSLCVCRGYSYKSTLQRYCVDSHGWYVRHTSEVCSRVRRLAFSKNLKQQCLARMCVKLRREMTTA